MGFKHRRLDLNIGFLYDGISPTNILIGCSAINHMDMGWSLKIVDKWIPKFCFKPKMSTSILKPGKSSNKIKWRSTVQQRNIVQSTWTTQIHIIVLYCVYIYNYIIIHIYMSILWYTVYMCQYNFNCCRRSLTQSR